MSFPCLKVSVRTVHVGFRGDQLEPGMRGLRRFCQLVYGRKAPLAPAAAKVYTSPLGARRGLDEREADEFGMDNSHNDTPEVEGRRKFPHFSSAGF